MMRDVDSCVVSKVCVDCRCEIQGSRRHVRHVLQMFLAGCSEEEGNAHLHDELAI